MMNESRPWSQVATGCCSNKEAPGEGPMTHQAFSGLSNSPFRREPRVREGQMERARRNALLWLLAGVAFLVAGLMADRWQIGFFVVAVLDFAVANVTLRRARKQRPPAT